jgi:hypothetical protein
LSHSQPLHNHLTHGRASVSQNGRNMKESTCESLEPARSQPYLKLDMWMEGWMCSMILRTFSI